MKTEIVIQKIGMIMTKVAFPPETLAIVKGFVYPTPGNLWAYYVFIEMAAEEKIQFPPKEGFLSRESAVDHFKVEQENWIAYIQKILIENKIEKNKPGYSSMIH